MSEQIDSDKEASAIAVQHMVIATAGAFACVCIVVGPRTTSAILVAPVIGYWFARKYYLAKTITIKDSKEVERIKPVPESCVNPYPRVYDLPLPELFARVRDVFEEMVFGLGGKWRINTDTAARRMSAELRITDNDIKRYLRADIHFKESEEVRGTPENTTIMYVSFDARSESSLYLGLKEYMEDLMRELDRRVPPIMVANPRQTVTKGVETTVKYKIEFQKFQKPSKWLVGFSCFAALALIADLKQNGPFSGSSKQNRNLDSVQSQSQ